MKVMLKAFICIYLVAIHAVVFSAPSSSQRSLIAKEQKNKIKKEFRNNQLVLITGCGRSGTTYISKLLTAAGCQVRHEKLGQKGCASWTMAVDADYTPWGPGARGIQFKHVFHQVRNPLDVISSVYINIKDIGSWQFIGANTPEILPNEPFLAKCAKYWYYWNLKAEEKAEWTYRIEDIDKIFYEMCNRLKIPYKKDVLKKIPRKINTQRPIFQKIKWSDLEAVLSPTDFCNLRNLALRYGYSDKD